MTGSTNALTTFSMQSRRLNTVRPATWLTLATLSLVVGLTGCTRTTDINQGGLFSSSQPDPLPPAPTARVQAQPIQPASPTPPPAPSVAAPQVPQPTFETPEEKKPEQVAIVEPKPQPEQSTQPVTREALIGRWTVSGRGSNCDIFLALTKWGSGFRAAGRQCGATGLGGVSSWNVAGNQVVLFNDSGQQIASLNRTGAERYSGSASGGAVTFSR